MSEAPSNSKKRKRSSVACGNCHHRKVRCNILTHGSPCTNCQLDGSRCEIYRRLIGLPVPQSPLAPTSASRQQPDYRSSPLPSSTRDISIRGIVEVNTFNEHAAPPDAISRRSLSTRVLQPVEEPSVDGLQDHGKEDFMPYYAGEAQGLEFLFDQCNPERRDRGFHYLTPRRTYRYKRLARGARKLSPHLPQYPVRQELIRCFFHYAYPALPIVNAKEFLEMYEHNLASISPLLLWSIFFCALNFVDDEFLKTNKLKPRKVLKEKYYQAAKDIYDRQEEEDKTILIQSAILLGMWYVDLEDRDGSWYWTGVAISLCHTIGLHRASNYEAMYPVPFSRQLRSLWRRIWWSCFTRECWLAMGFGRPLRVHLEDCDEAMPCTDDIMEEIRELPNHLREEFLPSDVDVLVDSGIILVHLAAILSEILTMHYRPRSLLPSPAILAKQETEILTLRAKLPSSITPSDSATVQRCHFEMVFNSVLIALYRPYLARSQQSPMLEEEAICRKEVIPKAKKAATDTTCQLNKLMSLSAIDQSPSYFIAATMSSMQILVFEIRNSSRLNKDYAKNQIEMHMIVLSHLRKTYWTADVQYNMFKTCLKTLETEANISDHTMSPPAQEHRAGDMGPPNRFPPRNVNPALERFEAESSLAVPLYEDILAPFNPFIAVPSYTDELGVADWDISDSVSMDSLHSNPNP